jgi:hypothetical protein
MVQAIIQSVFCRSLETTPLLLASRNNGYHATTITATHDLQDPDSATGASKNSDAQGADYGDDDTRIAYLLGPIISAHEARVANGVYEPPRQMTMSQAQEFELSARPKSPYPTPSQPPTVHMPPSAAAGRQSRRCPSCTNIVKTCMTKSCALCRYCLYKAVCPECCQIIGEICCTMCDTYYHIRDRRSYSCKECCSGCANCLCMLGRCCFTECITGCCCIKTVCCLGASAGACYCALNTQQACTCFINCCCV